MFDFVTQVADKVAKLYQTKQKEKRKTGKCYESTD